MNETITSGTGTGIIAQAKNIVTPIVNAINGLLHQVLPGKEEWVVIGLALYLGWQSRNREYVSGGYDVLIKASFIIYLLLKILGFGIKFNA
jgi:hypothetical protein